MIQLNKFETIILDLGGVIIDISPNNVLDALERLNKTTKTRQQILDEIKSLTLIEQHEVGELTDRQFIFQLGKVISNDDEGAILDAWHSMLGEIPEERIAKIKELKRTHKVCLLSNTNDLHLSRIQEYLHHQYNISLTELFDHVFFSQKIGFRKPSREIYAHVLSASGVKAETAVFVDDVLENAKSAEQVGIVGYHLDLSQNKLHQIFNHG
ncbi:MAG TPA: HAD family phosphatase [Cytophagales bacterium]|nr:HAD family phosphatase [Cytophagales bacterium]